jgi:nicotinate phosphoribosyltransferase
VLASRDIVDAFGVGGAIANAPVIDFSMDIVEIHGKPLAKRGKRSGTKQVYELRDGTHMVLPLKSKKPQGARPLIGRLIDNGSVVKVPDMHEARQRVIGSLQRMPPL